jgi:predicted dehydrogenase
MNTSDQVKVGIVGCGEHAKENLIPSLWMSTCAEVVAVCDIDEANARRTAARFPRAEAYTDFRRLLNEAGVHAVVAAAPPQVHQEVAKMALALGIHVFVEKPPTVTTRALIDLAEQAKQTGLITMVGHNLRHANASIEMKSVISRPDFGRPQSMEVRYYASKPRGDRWGLGSPLRSFLLSHVNHALDLMKFQVGCPCSVDADASVAASGSITLATRLSFESGGVGTLFASTSQPHFSVHATVLGENDAFVVMDSLHRLTGFGFAGDTKRRGRNWIEQQLSSGYYHAGYQTELELFLEAISGRAAAHPSFADEIPIYRVIDEIERQIGIREPARSAGLETGTSSSKEACGL